ncbi:D-beta-hydroxybutyrate dehydrogenase, partial [Litorilinea aerophila]
VNIGSIHSVVASPFKVGYITAKHGLLGLTRTAAREGGPYGITVNAILPAYVRTPLVERQIVDQARIHGIPPDAVVEEVMLAPAAIKRLIEPHEVASLVAYLCSEQAGAITGAAWTVDLGWTAA